MQNAKLIISRRRERKRHPRIVAQHSHSEQVFSQSTRVALQSSRPSPISPYHHYSMNMNMNANMTVPEPIAPVQNSTDQKGPSLAQEQVYSSHSVHVVPWQVAIITYSRNRHAKSEENLEPKSKSSRISTRAEPRRSKGKGRSQHNNSTVDWIPSNPLVSNPEPWSADNLSSPEPAVHGNIRMTFKLEGVG